MLKVVIAAALFALSVPATALPICSGGDRAERRLTCIVDGDTGWEYGQKWRLVGRSGGVDAPEISRPRCAAEERKGIAARDRLRELMKDGYEITQGEMDRYGRTLVTIRLLDGSDAGDTLIAEGLAQPWPNRGAAWCGE